MVLRRSLMATEGDENCLSWNGDALRYLLEASASFSLLNYLSSSQLTQNLALGGGLVSYRITESPRNTRPLVS
jgi:hypothetical protein